MPADQSTLMLAKDMQTLMGLDNALDIWNHPEFEEASEVVASYSRYEASTIELRFRRVVELITKKKLYASVEQQTSQYLKGLTSADLLTDEQISICEATIAA